MIYSICSLFKLIPNTLNSEILGHASIYQIKIIFRQRQLKWVSLVLHWYYISNLPSLICVSVSLLYHICHSNTHSLLFALCPLLVSAIKQSNCRRPQETTTAFPQASKKKKNPQYNKYFINCILLLLFHYVKCLHFLVYFVNVFIYKPYLQKSKNVLCT